MKIIITGGHLSPAVALIEELHAHSKNVSIVYAGRTRPFESHGIPSEEEHVVRSYGVRFVPFDSGRLSRVFSVHSIRSIFRIPNGFFCAFMVLKKERPDAIVTFGGYIGFPLAIVGYLLKIPIILHEQTIAPGISTRIISYFAQKIFVTYPDTKCFTRPVEVVGLPIRKSLLSTTEKRPFPMDDSLLPIIYIAGGTTGSVSINEGVFQIISRLLESYVVIHQTGRISHTKALQIKDFLPIPMHRRYIVSPYFDVHAVSWIYHHMTLYIGRSGGNTVGELAALGKVGLFIPLPWASNNEQFFNAKILKNGGSAEILLQKDVSPEKCMHMIENMMHHMKKYLQNAKRISSKTPTDAGKKIVQYIEQHVHV